MPLQTYELTTLDSQQIGTAVAHSLADVRKLAALVSKTNWSVSQVEWRDEYHGDILKGRPLQTMLLIGPHPHDTKHSAARRT